MGKKRSESDEYYVLNICDEVLGEKGYRQYRFDFLRGDGVRRTRLPVDIYYPNKLLVIEYREKQHYETVPFFDKPDKMTVSGVPRSLQRQIYDKRREEVLPKNGIDIVIISFSELDSKNGKLIRNHEKDIKTITTILGKYIL